MTEEVVNMFLGFNCIKAFSEQDIAVTFSIYKNGIPGSGKSESREIITLSLFELKNTQLNSYLGISEEFELAVNSLVRIKSIDYHIPQIDFYCNNLEVVESRILSSSIFADSKIFIYETGKSFHGYHDRLLSSQQWQRYMGQLLLLNTYNNEIIDSRWVGHSLIQGYSSLRVTRNTSAYLKKPKLSKVLLP